jgi:hypothetical protein
MKADAFRKARNLLGVKLMNRRFRGARGDASARDAEWAAFAGLEALRRPE